MDPVISRQMYRTLEPFHAMIYFVPEARSAYERIGLQGRPMGYFASRGAPLGEVSGETLAAIFYNFHPALVRSVIPAAWERAKPAGISAARLEAVDAALRRMLGSSLDAPEVSEAASLAREAVTACAPEGRPLFAATATLPWPDAPHLRLWHGVTLLREFRFGGHCAALITEGFSACEALVTHAATGEISAKALQSSRAWPDAEWEATCQRLRERGWLTAENTLTEEGQARRAAVEQRTDQLALPPWEHLGDVACKRLRELVRPFSKAITEAGTFPVSLSPWED
ncbi:MAG TPA: hypothetical protein VKT82_11365 [Ktedonobacterales bacterium]|nr:hypothetical protein [Ktedonobacterales bacterium]